MSWETKPWHFRSWDQTPPLLPEYPGEAAVVDVSRFFPSFVAQHHSLDRLYKVPTYGFPAVFCRSLLRLLVLSGHYFACIRFSFT